MWVGGTKAGFIAYIGETKFAPGEWAGIVLDEPVGKNDGSVAGVRYFQCEPKKGVFARPAKVTRHPVMDDGLPPAAEASSMATPRPTPKTNGTTSASGLSKLAQPTPKPGLGVRKSVSGSTASLKTSPTGSVSNMNSHPNAAGGMQVGDRVLVSGTKAGTLRYLGTTAFAKGEWAGVELDDPQGKNDGSVAGKRYVFRVFQHKKRNTGENRKEKTLNCALELGKIIRIFLKLLG